MSVEAKMPKFGLTMHEGTIQRFFKQPGQSLAPGEPLYEVETEKVLYEVETPAPGLLALLLFPEGSTVECGVAVAVIAEAGEDPAAVAARYGQAPPPATAPAAVDGQATPAPDGAAAPAGSRITASPIARKLAAEKGLDLSQVTGTGPGGRITREDVERALQQPPQPSPAPAPAAAPPPPATEKPQAGPAVGPSPAASAEAIPLRGMRRTIAQRMMQSLHNSAQLTITTEADVTAATELRAHLSREFNFTYTDLMIHAVARALQRHPRMNARSTADAILPNSSCNVGLAVALEDGLIVPVVRDADKKSLRQIAETSRALGEKARAGQLRVEDVSDGTFTISNLGTYGVDAFTPILIPGETGLLGLGRIVEKPAIWRGEMVARSMMTLSLSFDHRIIDGAPAAAFLRSVVEIFNFGER